MREDQKNQAFPDEGNYGISMRDYFAARAMQTMLGWDNDHTNWDSYAEDAYMMADAMLKAREQ